MVTTLVVKCLHYIWNIVQDIWIMLDHVDGLKMTLPPPSLLMDSECKTPLNTLRCKSIGSPSMTFLQRCINVVRAVCCPSAHHNSWLIMLIHHLYFFMTGSLVLILDYREVAVSIMIDSHTFLLDQLFISIKTKSNWRHIYFSDIFWFRDTK